MNSQLELPSLRNRLLKSLLLLILMVWIVAGWVSYYKANDEAGELLDGQLVQSAKLLFAQIKYLPAEPKLLGKPIEEMVSRADHPYEQSLEFQVWGRDGRLFLKSDLAPLTRLSEQNDGYADIVHSGVPWRTFVMWSPDQAYQIIVAESVEGRERAALEVAIQVELPILFIVPVVALMIIWAVRDALQPLERLTEKVASRSANNLTPLAPAHLPREVFPLVVALNHLLERLNRTLEGERRFTADASHELRTPLAAIQIQAQVASAASDEAVRSHALAQVVAGTRRMTRLVAQLLRLARLDPLAGLPHAESVALAACVTRLITELGIDCDKIKLEIADNVEIAVDCDLFQVALRNLLDNARRYGSEDGMISIGFERTPQQAKFWVADQGPGVPADELPRLCERFYRGSQIHPREGCGLGLAIVARIAHLHGAEVQVSNCSDGGLCVAWVWHEIIPY